MGHSYIQPLSPTHLALPVRVQPDSRHKCRLYVTQALLDEEGRHVEPHPPNVSGRGISEPRSGWHFFLDRMFHVFLLNFLGTEGPGMFNVTSPQEVGDDA